MPEQLQRFQEGDEVIIKAGIYHGCYAIIIGELENRPPNDPLYKTTLGTWYRPSHLKLA